MSESLGRKLIRIKPADDLPAHAEGADDKSLARSLGVFSLAMIGVGATIGTGIFFTMAEAVPKAGPSVILSFLIGIARAWELIERVDFEPHEGLVYARSTAPHFDSEKQRFRP